LFLSFPSRWAENAPPRITIEQQRRMAGYRGAYEEEDSVQQTKDEPSDRYKENQQEALDQWIMWVLDLGSFSSLSSPER